MATQQIELVDGYLQLANGKMFRNAEGMPEGLYVRGRLAWTGKPGFYRFYAIGDVLGEGELAAGGEAGWMDLYSGRCYCADDGNVPSPPYVVGYIDADGDFRPSSRTVMY